MLGQIIDPLNRHGYQFLEQLKKEYEIYLRTSIIASRPKELNDFIDYYQNGLFTAATHVNNDNKEQLLAIANTHTLQGMYASTALSANGKAKYGYNPESTRIVNGYRKAQNTLETQPDVLNIIETKVDDYVLELLPNPANTQVLINFGNSQPEYIIISSLNGETIRNEKVIKQNHLIDLQNVSNGLYFVKANNSNKVYKLVVIK
jgi:hypothetical protein